MPDIVARLSRLLPHAPAGTEVERQFGAIPFARVEGTVAFLLITSRRTGRWIFPKGSMIDGLEPWEVAAREAHEEAGITGRVTPVPVGNYRDWKTRNLRRTPIEVTMYPLQVDEQLDVWRESGQRHRHWAILPEARRLLTSPSLVEMITRIDQQERLKAGQRAIA